MIIKGFAIDPAIFHNQLHADLAQRHFIQQLCKGLLNMHLCEICRFRRLLFIFVFLLTVL